MSKPLLVVIAGPTAVGKTALGIALAKHFDTEILSCDSRQIYKELGIAVAKPSKSELQEVKHHFIDHCSIKHNYNAGEYEKEANAILKKLFESKNIAFMVGGTGLYIKACTTGLDQLPAKDMELRSRLADANLEQLQAELNQLDATAELSDPNNPQRLIRAIEIVRGTGLPLSESLKQSQHERDYRCLFLYLDADRETLYQRIDQRVDLMVDSGMENEARALYPLRELNALQTVGYNEWFKYFDGQWDKSTAIAKIKQHSRNYAKRQITWFKNQNYQAVQGDADELISIIEKELEHFQ